MTKITFYKSLQMDLILIFRTDGRETEELSPLTDIGTCGLQTVHNSLKAGIKSSAIFVIVFGNLTMF